MDGLDELGHEPLGHRVELFRVEQAEQAAEGDRHTRASEGQDATDLVTEPSTYSRALPLPLRRACQPMQAIFGKPIVHHLLADVLGRPAVHPGPTL